MREILFPEGFRLEPLQRRHPRKSFDCGELQVNEWLWTKALQQQDKHLSATTVLLDPQDKIAGYYTLATGQMDFKDLPSDLVRQLPRRALPVAILAWFGVHSSQQGKQLGDRLLAFALRDCYEAGKTFAFVAVILDCVNVDAKSFYERRDFAELPGNSYRLFLSADALAVMMNPP